MYPGNEFNQVIQQALKREQLKQIKVEVQETFGDHRNRRIDMPIEALDSMEYHYGVLVVSYTHPRYGMTTTEFIKWEDVRSIQFNDTFIADPRDFSFHPTN